MGCDGDWIKRKFTIRGLLVVFTIINIVNYIDRGIIPGANDKIGDWICNDLNKTSSQTYIGLLQSSFIAGYSVASVIFGHLVHKYRPFNLVGIGLSTWCVAVIVNAIAPHYWVAILGRVLSGVGEASFQCVIPPFIDDHADKKKKSLYLGVFTAAIPVGTAMGFGYGTAIAHTKLGWRYAFFFESFLMMPFIVFVFILSCAYPKLKDEKKEEGDEIALVEHAEGGDEIVEQEKKPVTFIQELCSVVSSPIWLFTTIGYAVFTGSTAGISTFGTRLVKKIGYVRTSMQASLLFGGITCIGGIIGGLGGGILLDKISDPAEHRKLATAQQLVFTSLALGVGAGLLAVAIPNAIAFFGLLLLTIIFLFSTSSPITLSLIWSVPPQSRSFSVGLAVLCIHAFGDVPSPIILGAIADSLVPDSVDDPKRLKRGWKIVLSIAVLWLILGVLSFIVGFILSRRKRNRIDNPEGEDATIGDNSKEALLNGDLI